jgi:hypothetical protein
LGHSPQNTNKEVSSGEGRKKRFVILVVTHYTWKCHNETACVAISNKQKYLFSKTKGKEK